MAFSSKFQFDDVPETLLDDAAQTTLVELPTYGVEVYPTAHIIRNDTGNIVSVTANAGSGAPGSASFSASWDIDPGTFVLVVFDTQTKRWVPMAGDGYVPAVAGGGSVLAGATDVLNGTSGAAPAPSAGEQDLVLHGDGTWRALIPDWAATTAYSAGALVYESGTTAIYRADAAFTSGATFSAGNWTLLADVGGGGSTPMTGATSVAAGTAGTVPAPAAGEQDNILFGDADWGQMFPAFSGTTAYSLGAVIAQNGNLWKRTAAGTSLSTFALDRGFWTQVSAGVLEPVTGSTGAAPSFSGASGHHHTYASTGATATFDTPVNLLTGHLYAMDLQPTGQDTTYTFPVAYTDHTGTQLSPITVVDGERQLLMFLATSANTLVQVGDGGSSTGIEVQDLGTPVGASQTVNWDASSGAASYVVLDGTSSGTTTFAAPTNLEHGNRYSLVITNNDAAARGVAFNSAYKNRDGGDLRASLAALEVATGTSKAFQFVADDAGNLISVDGQEAIAVITQAATLDWDAAEGSIGYLVLTGSSTSALNTIANASIGRVYELTIFPAAVLTATIQFGATFLNSDGMPMGDVIVDNAITGPRTYSFRFTGAEFISVSDQGYRAQTLVDATAVSWDCADGRSAALAMTDAVVGTRTIGQPTNQVGGRVFNLRVYNQGATTQTVAWNNNIVQRDGSLMPQYQIAQNEEMLFTFVSDGLGRMLSQAELISGKIQTLTGTSGNVDWNVDYGANAILGTAAAPVDGAVTLNNPIGGVDVVAGRHYTLLIHTDVNAETINFDTDYVTRAGVQMQPIRVLGTTALSFVGDQDERLVFLGNSTSAEQSFNHTAPTTVTGDGLAYDQFSIAMSSALTSGIAIDSVSAFNFEQAVDRGRVVTFDLTFNGTADYHDFSFASSWQIGTGLQGSQPTVRVRNGESRRLIFMVDTSGVSAYALNWVDEPTYYKEIDSVIGGWYGAGDNPTEIGVDRVETPWSGDHAYRLEDSDAVNTREINLPLGQTAFVNTDTFVYELGLVSDTANVNHVVRVRYEDDGGNIASQLFEIGTTGAAVVASADDAGNVTSSAGITVHDRGDSDLLLVKLTLVWTGASGALPRLTVTPAYNFVGDAVEVATAVGTVDLVSFASGAVSEFAGGSGLDKLGEVTSDADPGEGLVRLDASGGAFTYTLPAATGSQDRRILHRDRTDGTSNVVTIAVQSGEALNGTADGTYSLVVPGERLELLDDSAGNWSLQVVGAGDVNTLDIIQVSLTATTNDSGLTHYGFDETVSSQGTGLTLSGTGSIQGLQAGKTYKLTSAIQLTPPSAGVVDFATFRFVDLTASAAIGEPWTIYPNAATSIIQSNQGTQTAFFTPTVTSEVGLDFDSGTLGELSVQSTFTVEEVPSSEVVLAGMAEIQDLHYGRVNAASDLANTSYSATAPGTKVPFDNTVLASGMTASGTDGFTLVNTGRYRADWLLMASSNDVDDDAVVHVALDGVSVGSVAYNMLNSGAVNQTTGMLEFDATAGQVVELFYEGDPTADSIPFDAGSYFNVSQIASKSVTHPDLVEATPLHRAKLALSSDLVLTAGVATVLALDVEDYDIGAIADPGTGQITLMQDGTYLLSATWTNITAAANDTLCEILVDGVAVATGGENQSSGGGTGRRSPASTTRTLSAGQVITMRVTCGDQNTTVAGNATEDGSRARLEIVQLATESVISPEDTLVTDQAASGYMDIGNMRMAWGVTPGAAQSETVTFPGGGFAAAPVVTMTTVDASNAREQRIDNLTATTVDVVNASANRVKHWHAIGLKP